MEKRFESKSEASGQERVDTPEGRKWFDWAIHNRLIDFKDSRSSSELSNDDYKLADLTDDERTEFYMVVAQRFKDAGERFMSFVRGRGAVVPELADSSDSKLNMISEAQVMYADKLNDAQQEIDGKNVSQAPPFDFAVENQSVGGFRERRVTTSAAPQNVRMAGEIDDFDFPVSEAGERVREIAKHGDVTTLTYRPRLREILFAAGVGKTAVSTKEIDDADRAARHERIEQQVKDFMDEQNNVDTGKPPAVAGKAASPTPEILKVVKDAVEKLLEPEPTGSDVMHPDTDLSDESSEVTDKEEPFTELEFSKLKPSQTSAKEQTLPTVPDNVRIRTITNSTDSPKRGSHEIRNPFAEQLFRSQTVEDPKTTTHNNRQSEPMSVNEILANRTNLPNQTDHKLPGDAKQYYMITRRNSGLQVVLGVITILVIVALWLAPRL